MVMPHLQFDEIRLMSELGSLPPNRRSLFAALVATRLAPSYDIYASHSGREKGLLDSPLNYLWEVLRTGALPEPSDQTTRQIEATMQLMPDEEDGPVFFGAQAEDAAAALAYALRSLNDPNPQEAAWAARRAYEAVDNLVTSRPGVVVGGPAEVRILQHHLIQAELSRQARDVEIAANLSITSSDLTKTRLECLSWGIDFFERAREP